MKNLILISCCIICVSLLSSCTIQFKAKELEMDGHVETTYEFDNLAWTQIPTGLPD